MTPLEAIALCRYAKACCPQQAFDEYTPDAWAELLEDERLDDAKEAVKRICRRQPFVSPAEIIAEAAQVRVDHVRSLRLSSPPDGIPGYGTELSVWWRNVEHAALADRSATRDEVMRIAYGRTRAWIEDVDPDAPRRIEQPAESRPTEETADA